MELELDRVEIKKGADNLFTPFLFIENEDKLF